MTARQGPGYIDAIAAALTPDGRLPDDPEAIAEMIDRFNALPFEERGRILGLDGPPPSPWAALTSGLDLPPAPPAPAHLDDMAARAPILSVFAQVRDFVGGGRRLTPKGNLGRADAASLGAILGDPAVELLDDIGSSVRSADDLARTQLALRWARAAGAVRVAKSRMSATSTWAGLAPSDQARRAATALLAKGPLTMFRGDGYWAPGALDQVVEEGLPSMLAVLWAVPEGADFEIVLERAFEICEAMLRWDPIVTADSRMSVLRHGLDLIFELLGQAGVVDRAGAEEAPGPGSRLGRTSSRGGLLALTPLGRALLGDYLGEHGFSLPEAGSLVGEPLQALIGRVGEWHPDRIRAEFDHWVAAHSPAEAAAGLGEALMGGYRTVQSPLAVLDLAGRLPDPHREDAVRAVLATPARGHAMVWLTQRGRPDVPEDPEARTVAGIELLAMTAEGGDDDQFRDLIVQIDDPMAFVSDCQLHPGTASVQVLRAVGRVHPDPEVARAARAAAMRLASAPARAVPRKRDAGAHPSRRGKRHRR